MSTILFWLAIPIVLLRLAIVITRFLHRHDALAEQDRIGDDAHARLDEVAALCARDRLGEAARVYATLRLDASSRALAPGVGYAFAVAAGTLAARQIARGDLEGARAVVGDLAALAARADAGLHEGMGLLIGTSAIAEALIAAGELASAHDVVALQVRAVRLAPQYEVLHVTSVDRLADARARAS